MGGPFPVAIEIEQPIGEYNESVNPHGGNRPSASLGCDRKCYPITLIEIVSRHLRREHWARERSRAFAAPSGRCRRPGWRSGESGKAPARFASGNFAAGQHMAGFPREACYRSLLHGHIARIAGGGTGIQQVLHQSCLFQRRPAEEALELAAELRGTFIAHAGRRDGGANAILYHQ